MFRHRHLSLKVSVPAHDAVTFYFTLSKPVNVRKETDCCPGVGLKDSVLKGPVCRIWRNLVGRFQIATV